MRCILKKMLTKAHIKYINICKYSQFSKEREFYANLAFPLLSRFCICVHLNFSVQLSFGVLVLILILYSTLAVYFYRWNQVTGTLSRGYLQSQVQVFSFFVIIALVLSVRCHGLSPRVAWVLLLFVNNLIIYYYLYLHHKNLAKRVLSIGVVGFVNKQLYRSSTCCWKMQSMACHCVWDTNS